MKGILMPDMDEIEEKTKEKFQNGKEKLENAKGRLFDDDDDKKKRKEQEEEDVDIDPYDITKL